MTRPEAARQPGVGPDLRPVAIYGTFSMGQYYEDILAGVVAGAEAADTGVIAIQAAVGVLPSFLEVGSQQAVSRATWEHFDAAIVILETLSLEYLDQLHAAGKFIVSIAQKPYGTKVAVALDNASGVRAAVAHLIGHGHTRIGFLSPAWQVDTFERYNAYCAQLRESELTPLPLMGRDLSPELTMDGQGYRAAQDFLAGDRDCTAVMVGTDLIALGFMRGVREAGVAVPEQLAIVGVDDMNEAAVSTPPLATVAISFHRVGEIAVDLAIRGAAGEPLEGIHLVPQRFVPRESCGCPSSAGTGAADISLPPAHRFARALLEASQEGVIAGSVDTERVNALAGRVVALLSGAAHGGGYRAAASPDGADRSTIDLLATEIVDVCRLDRSVQAAVHAVRALAGAPGTGSDARPPQARVPASVVLDLCDAIRSHQLQRRMGEYVALKQLHTTHHFIGNSLLGGDRTGLRSLAWLRETPARTGALGLWEPPGQQDRLAIEGVFERNDATGTAAHPPTGGCVQVESFPPRWLLPSPGSASRLLVITQVRCEDMDWGLLAVTGDRSIQSTMVQATFQQWAVLMSTSLSQEKANADLARQAAELASAYETQRGLLEEVRISEERYALAAEAAQDAVWDWATDSGQVYYSGRWKALLGYRETEVGTGPDEWLGRIHPDDVEQVRGHLDRALAGSEDFFDFEHRLRTSSGEYRWIACTGRSVLDPGGRVRRLVGSVTDVTARRLLREQLEHEAMFDPLTELTKTRPFKDRLTEALALAQRDLDYRFALVFIDLNGFKAVNDSHGHAAGDQLLASVARRLKECLRRSDTAARLGGDEFVVLVSDIDHRAELGQIVDRISSRITAPHQIGALTVTVGAAIGVAISDADYATAEDMLAEADSAMYRAKREQRAPSLDQPSWSRKAHVTAAKSGDMKRL